MTDFTVNSQQIKFLIQVTISHPWFDAVGWATGRGFGLWKRSTNPKDSVLEDPGLAAENNADLTKTAVLAVANALNRSLLTRATQFWSQSGGLDCMTREH